jgi:Leucine-rich repeat (LRR) protein
MDRWSDVLAAGLLFLLLNAAIFSGLSGVYALVFGPLDLILFAVLLSAYLCLVLIVMVADVANNPPFTLGRKGRDEAAALEEAQLRIALCVASRSDTLDLRALGFTRLPQGLSELTWLVSLDLAGNGIGDKGATELATLPPLASLTSLNLEEADIGDEGAKALAALVSLTSLNLRDNRIGTEGVSALAALTSLTSLDLSYNDIGDEAVKALAVLTSLTHLGLAGTGLGPEGVRALNALTALTSVDLGDNNFKSQGAEVDRALASLPASLTIHWGGD